MSSIPTSPLDVISLDQAKSFLRVDFADDDDIITSLIYTAVALVEQKTQQRLYPRVETCYSDGLYNVDLFQTPINSVQVTTQDGTVQNWVNVRREPVRQTVVFRYANYTGEFTGYGNGFGGFGNAGFGDGLDNGIINFLGGASSLPVFNINVDCGYQDVLLIPYPLFQAVKTIISYTYENRDMSKVDLPNNIMLELEPYNRNPMF